ncbi:MAG: CDP-glucose 4,6-dehydratase [Actinomycetota bacterium]|nr:CDP-glucose 4,6-dehydratase [Actinomycetota bacterium]
MRPLVDAAFWRGRAVLITGHTGFKGAWLALWLSAMGARVTGLAPRPPTSPSLYALAAVGDGLAEVAADVRDFAAVREAVDRHAPEVVFHLAAQPLVRRSLIDPRTTYETNVMGTVNVLEAVRTAPSVRAVVTVTSDKCYANRDDGRPFVEEDRLGGHDPYSSSKACAELVADAYRSSFFAAGGPEGGTLRLASARAGNVIGGGDWGQDRLIPDLVRGALAGRAVPIRHPDAVRPWQHVLNPLSGYLRLAQAVWDDPGLQGGWNFGPPDQEARPVRWIVARLSERWPGGLRVELDPGPHPREAHLLSLDSTKARERLGWSPTWSLEEALDAVVAWYDGLRAGEDVRALTLAQIEAFAGSASVASGR